MSFSNSDASWETIALREPMYNDESKKPETMQRELIEEPLKKDQKIVDLEGKLEELRLKLEQKEIELQNNAEANHKFISIVAHDLRSPFNSILGYLELLKRNLRTYDIDKIESFVDYSYGAALKTYRLLDSLLEWASSKNGKIAFQPTKLNLYKVIQEEIDFMDFVAKKKNIVIELTNTNYINVFADQQMLKSIIRNLLNNAIKYTNEGGKIEISSEICGEYVMVSVKDNGIGMSDDALNSLFKLSTIHTTAGTGNERGSGLGLLTCKEFIELHGGKIIVESKTGEGSTFRFSLPADLD